MLKGNEKRHVISCPADSALWRPLADKGFLIYTPELLLTGILTQRVDWDNEEYLVEESR
jgi:mediator of DNA damage checkpoint protein 1